MEFSNLKIIHNPVSGLYDVLTKSGIRLASFRNFGQAESYRKSKLLEIALDIRGAILSDSLRKDDAEEETLP